MQFLLRPAEPLPLLCSTRNSHRRSDRPRPRRDSTRPDPGLDDGSAGQRPEGGGARRPRRAPGRGPLRPRRPPPARRHRPPRLRQQVTLPARTQEALLLFFFLKISRDFFWGLGCSLVTRLVEFRGVARCRGGRHLATPSSSWGPGCVEMASSGGSELNGPGRF
jgi:hypothetical protein